MEVVHDPAVVRGEEEPGNQGQEGHVHQDLMISPAPTAAEELPNYPPPSWCRPPPRPRWHRQSPGPCSKLVPELQGLHEVSLSTFN